MADVAKTYGVGDSVFVAYPFPSTLAFTPQARTVKSVDINSSTNEAVVKFTDGADVIDGAVQTIYDTNVLCATAIIDDVIAKIEATVLIEGLSNSLGSTVSQPALNLGRVDA